MSQLLIQKYLNEIDRYKKYSGSSAEGVTSEAFKDLLKAWAKQNHLIFINQYEFQSPQKNRIRPDGTILHDLRVPLGYWEAKDSDDDLDAEIAKKLAKGYPQDNIIFEDTITAVLIQNRHEVLRCKLLDTERLAKLLALFFSYERQEIADFRKAVVQFSIDLPAVLGALRARITEAYAGNAPFRKAANAFLKQAKGTINPSVTEADIQEMLIQHILTEEIFAHVFSDGDFHRENNIAKQLYGLEEKFFTKGVKRDTLKALEPYYAAIRANAAQISSHIEKQTFLKVIYERFYKVYNPKAADRLGVVYTPHEIVKFMVEGADWLCQKHFGKALIDPHVEILDPATGTGTFICELLEHFRGQPEKLMHKYKEELHANEVAILPYYVANLNIEATYATITGQFGEYPNLCFVDTLDNVAGLGKFSGFQEDLFGAMSEENVERIKRQNRRKISVVIGNPPYNANQQNENDNNKNREYQRIDGRIKETYIKQSTAQKTKLYDMYARFFRWASDRMHDEGVLAFVTNNSFINARTYDGFRKVVAQEFNDIWIVNLEGDARTGGERRRQEGGNIFEDQIRVGVAISFFVKKKKSSGCFIQYEEVADYAKAEDKTAFIAAKRLEERSFQILNPDSKNNWINLTENDWDSLIPVADKRTKAATTKGQERAIFKLFSLGVSTSRDDWVYGENSNDISIKVDFLKNVYNADLAKILNGNNKYDANNLDYTIKWTRSVKADLKSGVSYEPALGSIVKSCYRPFISRFLHFNGKLVEVQYQQTKMFGETGSLPNKVIVFTDASSQKEFMLHAVDHVFDYHFVGAAAAGSGLPLYRYLPDGSRVENITDWALKQFRAHYKNAALPSPLAGEGGERSETDEGAPGASRKVEAGRDNPASGASRHPRDDPRGQALLPQGEKGRPGAAARPITKDAIFHYVYGVLHDPLYREKYAQNLKREFPRLPFYPDFWQWADWGERLMALHIGFETVEFWPLNRIEAPDARARAANVPPKVILKSLSDEGTIKLDSETTLTGIPPEAFSYRLGNRSGLDWILDQYKEKTPKDPTIREKFNTYRFKDYKEKVIDLIARVTRVSVETVAITKAMTDKKR